MSEQLLSMAERMRHELADLERLVERVQEGWLRAQHIVRHVYTFRFDPAKVQPLVEHIQVVFLHVRAELLAFAEFLEGQGKEAEGN